MSRGFTLLEMAIVVLILGIVAMLGMPLMVASVNDARLSGVSSEIVAALNHARSSAMSTGRACKVTFDTDDDTVKVEQLAYAHAAEIIDPAVGELSEAEVEASKSYVAMEDPLKRGADYVVGFAASDRQEGADIVSALFDDDSVVTFGGLGVPSSGGVVTVTCGGRQAVVTVDKLTGKVTQSP